MQQSETSHNQTSEDRRLLKMANAIESTVNYG